MSELIENKIAFNDKNPKVKSSVETSKHPKLAFLKKVVYLITYCVLNNKIFFLFSEVDSNVLCINIYKKNIQLLVYTSNENTPPFLRSDTEAIHCK